MVNSDTCPRPTTQARIQQSRRVASGTHRMSSKAASWTLDSSFGSTLGQSLNTSLNQSLGM